MSDIFFQYSFVLWWFYHTNSLHVQAYRTWLAVPDTDHVIVVDSHETCSTKNRFLSTTVTTCKASSLTPVHSYELDILQTMEMTLLLTCHITIIDTWPLWDEPEWVACSKHAVENCSTNIVQACVARSSHTWSFFLSTLAVQNKSFNSQMFRLPYGSPLQRQ